MFIYGKVDAMSTVMMEVNDGKTMTALEVESFNAAFEKLHIRYENCGSPGAKKAFVRTVLKPEFHGIKAQKEQAEEAAREDAWKKAKLEKERREALSERKPAATSSITHTVHGTMAHAPTFNPNPKGMSCDESELDKAVYMPLTHISMSVAATDVDEFGIDTQTAEMFIDALEACEKLYPPNTNEPNATSAAASIGTADSPPETSPIKPRAHSPPALDLSKRPRKKMPKTWVPVTGKEFFFKANYTRAITPSLMSLIEDDGLHASREEIQKFWVTEQATHLGQLNLSNLDFKKGLQASPVTEYTYMHPYRNYIKSKRNETMIEELLEAGALIDRDMLEEEFHILEKWPYTGKPIWLTSKAKAIMAKYDEGKKLIECATQN